MPFVFKISSLLLVLAALGGQFLQRLDASAGANAAAAALRAECPAMAGPVKIEDLGDQVRFYDAYLIRVIGGQVGFNSGCAR